MNEYKDRGQQLSGEAHVGRRGGLKMRTTGSDSMVNLDLHVLLLPPSLMFFILFTRVSVFGPRDEQKVVLFVIESKMLN